PLPVYGSEIDAALARPDPGEPLVDLPLRETTGAAEVTAPMVVPPPAPALPAARHAIVRRADRRRSGGGARMLIGAAVIGAVIAGGWLVRAQERPPLPGLARGAAARRATPVAHPTRTAKVAP